MAIFKKKIILNLEDVVDIMGGSLSVQHLTEIRNWI